MPRKKPQKPLSHENSEIARANLKAFFPHSWNFYRGVTDDSSGIEYGQDWIVEVVEDGSVSGAEFRIQSKVLSSKNAIKNDYIKTKIKVTTLNYLFDLPSPVLLHFYHIPSKEGYVMWMESWYVQNRRPEWENQEQVTVKIPLSNVLDNQQVSLIKSNLLQRHREYKLHETVDLINKTSSDYKVNLQFKDRDVYFTIEAKRDQAIPRIIALDEEAQLSIRHLLETGEVTEIKGLVQIENLPPLIFEDIGTNFLSLTGFPLLPEEEHLPMRIKYFASDGELLYETKYVDMKKTQSGTVIQKWQGSAHDNSVVYSFETNIRTHEYKFGSKFNFAERNPVMISENLQFLEALHTAEKFQAIDQRTDDVLIESKVIFDSSQRQMMELIKRMVKALATISTKTGLIITMPEKFLVEDLSTAEIAAQILTHGISSEFIDLAFPEYFELVSDLPAEVILRTLKLLDAGQENDFFNFLKPGKTIISVLGYNIDFGPCEYVFAVRGFLEQNQLYQRVKQLRSEETVNVTILVDKNRSYSRFPNWSSN